MPTRATRRPIAIPRLATFAVAFTLLSFAASDASAQSGGPFQRYSQRFYGQNFYDHQHNGYFSRGSCNRQHHAGIYGPAEMYSRQYGDQFGYATARPFVPPQTNVETGYLGPPLRRIEQSTSNMRSIAIPRSTDPSVATPLSDSHINDTFKQRDGNN